jgi:hypothetical protein
VGLRGRAQRPILALSGEDIAHQAGDICSVHPEGHRLTNYYYIECKHYRSLDLEAFLFGGGKMARYWRETCKQAAYYKRHPMLIAKQNLVPTLVLLRGGSLSPHSFDLPLTTIQVRGAPKLNLSCVVVDLERMLEQKLSRMLMLTTPAVVRYKPKVT